MKGQSITVYSCKESAITRLCVSISELYMQLPKFIEEKNDLKIIDEKKGDFVFRFWGRQQMSNIDLETVLNTKGKV